MGTIAAETLYDSDKEAAVAKLLEYHLENIQLKEKLAGLYKNSLNSSKSPSKDHFKGSKAKEHN
ncbi:MAG: hypothetical protein HQL06_06495 [Nitrospirae bacterium]|nr:hypothetical protein [Nitrospirota bacterium]